MSTKQCISNLYHREVGHFYYEPSNPMKQHRLKLTHHLILSYGLYKGMECYRFHFTRMITCNFYPKIISMSPIIPIT